MNAETDAPKMTGIPEPSSTPDEALRRAHSAITSALSADLLDRVQKATPAFFERLIVDLLLAMGYGGTSEEAGRALGQSGDDGVDGVIDQDPLGGRSDLCPGQEVQGGQQYRRGYNARLLRSVELEESTEGDLCDDI